MKKWIALLLAALMLLSLAACGGKEAETPAETTAAADEGAYHGELPFIKEGDEPVTLTIGLRTSGHVTDYKDNALTHWVEEKTGLNLEFMQFNGSTADTASQVALMIASGETLPDILRPGIGKIQADEYGLDGYFIDLKPYLEKYSYYEKQALALYYPEKPGLYDELVEGATEPGSGKIFAYPLMEDCPLDTPNYHTWINREWLDKLGLEIPMTLDELHEVLVAFRDKDPNGNGKKDEIPMVGRANGSYVDPTRLIVNAFVYWNSNYHFNVDENGKVWAPYDRDEYRDALILISDWVKEGLISTLTWTQTSAELKSLFNPTDGSEALCGVIFGHADTTFVPDSPSVFRYDLMKPLKGVTPLGGYAPRNDYSRLYANFITADCKHPDLAVKLIDFLCSPEAAVRVRWGEEGVNWVYSDGTKTGNLGGTAKIKLIGDLVFSTQGNKMWRTILTCNSERYWEYESDIGNMENWESCRITKLLQNYKNFEEIGMPEKVFTFVNYTQEENERRTEIDKELTDFIKDRRAQFCTGVLDPRSDADWQEYLKNLESLGYSEWVSLAQAAYDRLQNK